ncbi:MAG: hypothetical protein PHQ12_15015 [Chthoniobacteraceae bacterium]|nr:hypothetical protein [Chthoniobacteraceae bacterium]
MSAPASPPIPRQPIGTTFVVAISVLGAFAILQLIAVVWRYIPLARQQAAEPSPLAAEQPRPAPVAPAPQAPFRPDAQKNTQNLQKASRFLADADHNAHIGEYEAALKSLDEVEAISPGDPAALWIRAQVLERMDQPADAVTALRNALKYPSLIPANRAQIERKIDQLSRYLASTGQPAPAETAAPDASASAEEPAAPVRDEVGLQPGSTFGIVDARLKDGDKPGLKKLQVAVQVRPGVKIDPAQVQMAVYFYDDTEDGDIQPTESKVTPQWISPPVDWADNMPEILEVIYSLPDSDLPGSAASNGASGRKYHGFVVGVYYNKELQDFRSEPGDLQRKFPLPLYMKESNDAGQ